MKAFFKRLRLCIGALVGSALLAATPSHAQGLIRDAEIEAILREYSDPLFEAAGLQPSDVDIYIINDPSLNAFVANGQRVHLHTGLLMEAENPEELKGVIAHETGHISGGHNITRRQAMSSAMGPAWITIGLGVIAIAAGAPDAGAALLGSSQQFAALSFFKYTRIEESSADQAGLNFLEATGQSGAGLISFMEKLRYQEVLSAQRQDPYYRTHPVTSDRIGAMRKRVEEIEVSAKPQSERTLTQMAMMQAKLVGFLEPPTRVFAKYPPTDESMPARYARAIAAYRAVDIGAANREIDELIALEPDNPYFHELKGQILFENGRAEDSIAPHRRSVELSPRASLLHVNLARSLLAVGGEANVAEAEELLNRAIAFEPQNAFAWGQLARAYGALGREGEAQLATAEQAYVVGDYQRAYIFSRRAQNNLSPNTPQGRRANDISAITDPRNANGRGAARRGFAPSLSITAH
ncbi:MAG: M48 family metalloprotease [Pseudomonadota bacterium]